MKTVTRLCLCALLMFSFIAVPGCGNAKKETKPAAAGGTDTGAADASKDAEAK